MPPFNTIKPEETYVWFALKWNNADLHLNIEVEADSYSFIFWDCTTYPKGVENKAGEIFDKMGCFSEYKLDDGGRFYRKFAFPSQQGVLIEHIKAFKNKLDETIKSLPKPVS